MKSLLPKQLKEFIKEENQKVYFQDSCTDFVEFYKLSEIKKFEWNGIEVYDLLKEVENYESIGFLVWIPKFKSLGSIDIEHDNLSLFQGISFSKFFKEMGSYLSKLVDGLFEVELEDLLNSVTQYSPSSSIYGELVKRIQSSSIATMKFDFISEGQFLYEESFGSATLSIRYWQYKGDSTRRIYAAFGGYFPGCDYKGSLGEFRYVFKKDEYELPGLFYEKVEKLFRSVHKKYTEMFNTLQSHI
ncbi:hypothetical protein [Paenibacillus sp. Soil787]|uniref:hypothetical protein n=1 Tax=Paenibacillus sp. Soil787 TaxID=1736411 RepID=UPI000703A9EB|nr:hypothetical protein [Paenibacillus sp. Soil787]KRF20182.1 hypothetical protein ASG93_31205 [Paenibacillus sp. Soil787]